MKYASDKPRYSFHINYNSGLFASLISFTYVNLIQLCCFFFHNQNIVAVKHLLEICLENMPGDAKKA